MEDIKRRVDLMDIKKDLIEVTAGEVGHTLAKPIVKAMLSKFEGEDLFKLFPKDGLTATPELYQEMLGIIKSIMPGTNGGFLSALLRQIIGHIKNYLYPEDRFTLDDAGADSGANVEVDMPRRVDIKDMEEDLLRIMHDAEIGTTAAKAIFDAMVSKFENDDLRALFPGDGCPQELWKEMGGMIFIAVPRLNEGRRNALLIRIVRAIKYLLHPATDVELGHLAEVVVESIDSTNKFLAIIRRELEVGET